LDIFSLELSLLRAFPLWRRDMMDFTIIYNLGYKDFKK
jgi:hypothetical protein